MKFFKMCVKLIVVLATFLALPLILLAGLVLALVALLMSPLILLAARRTLKEVIEEANRNTVMFNAGEDVPNSEC